MSNDITLTVPMDYHALSRASDFFHGLAVDMKRDTENVPDEKAKPAASISIEISPAPEDVSYEPLETTLAEPKKGEVTAAPEPVKSATDAFGRGATTAPIVEGSEVPESLPEPNQAAGLDLDSDGLPWDSRIHSSSKSKLVKTNQWKKRRKPADQPEEQWLAYVDSVEAELRRLMKAGPHAPVVDAAPAPTIAPPAEPAIAPPAEPEPAIAPPAPEVSITTLPALFRFITDNGITDDVVMAAVKSQGVDSLPLLGARPDLIPGVVKAIQEG